MFFTTPGLGKYVMDFDFLVVEYMRSDSGTSIEIISIYKQCV